MTCHNRREKTLRCLESLFDQKDSLPFMVFLVDDGSTDGTSEAVTLRFPDIQIIASDGSAFWAGGMRKAWQQAQAHAFSAYLWLNDDVVLDPDALTRLQAENLRLQERSLVGGAMRDPKTSDITYSGSNRYDRHPFHFRRVHPEPNTTSPVDVLNGNLLLVPAEISERIGIMASYLVHHGGDYEYSLRAARHGFGVSLAPGSFGQCPANPAGRRVRGFAGLHRALSSKHLPLKMGIPMYKSMAGRNWWFWLVQYYTRCFLVGI